MGRATPQSRVLHRCHLPFALCLLPSLFWSLGCCLRSSAWARAPQRWKADARTPTAVVQLLAVGPSTGDKNRECSATGFFLNAAGYILTNAHVVEEARHCLAGSVEGKIVAKFESIGLQAEAVSCDVMAIDEIHDLAILRLDRPRAETGQGDFVVLDGNDVSTGTAVAVTGHSASSWQRATVKGRVIGRAKLALGESRTEKTEVLILNIPLQRGASGSPVYLESGAVLGIVSRQNPSRPIETVAVPIRHAIDLLTRLGVPWTSNGR
jgi:S1-C subfamily serine protease